MTYDYSTRLDKLGTRMKQLHNTTASATYTRGATSIAIPHVTPEKVDVTQLAAYGLTLVTDKCLDLVFDTSKLSPLANPEPVIGDTVAYRGITYEVFSIGDEVFRYTTITRQRIRIHLRQVA